ncbi:hypothetical protein F5X68DRAFT_55564 [Plectosphaerella plurivora]|uniref:Uncharacterized protein n=1 Tax=Plectosphaerella plurivora TaxID=936078 RepID=A0A9P9A6K6_9PEZI|nr:hypothetical protein F5X68DRAFT_55564 [Plectosphaerella plurivora]
MLSIAPHADHHCYSPLNILSSSRSSSDLSIFATMALGTGTNCSPPPSKLQAQASNVTQALEIARDSVDGASDPTVRNILENALAQVWAQITAAPDSYVMTRDEFAVFNYFQHRFTADEVAQRARKRYWDNMTG